MKHSTEVGDGGTHARHVQEQFGDAVAHFRQGLAQLEGRQRALQRAASSLMLVAVLVVAFGVVFTGWIMLQTRSMLVDWSTRASPVEPDWTGYRYEAVMLEFQMETPQGAVRFDGRIPLKDWTDVCLGLRGSEGVRSDSASAHQVRCGAAEWPVLRLRTVPECLERDSLPRVAEGTAVTCRPIRVFEDRTTSPGNLHDASLVAALSGGVVVDCVPTFAPDR